MNNERKESQGSRTRRRKAKERMREVQVASQCSSAAGRAAAALAGLAGAEAGRAGSAGGTFGYQALWSDRLSDQKRATSATSTRQSVTLAISPYSNSSFSTSYIRAGDTREPNTSAHWSLDVAVIHIRVVRVVRVVERYGMHGFTTKKISERNEPNP